MVERDIAPRRPQKRVSDEQGRSWMSKSMLGLVLVLMLLFLPACGSAGANESDDEQQKEQTEDEIPAPPGRP